ncbi:hypothetical protein Fmac_023228 [Flemingia macrophylla]|uniref:Uncharacterized protein n=1 Tax=Flemingia macrophylla TaxID=520843 RepID=A0ABD1LMJ9_9FABA
MAVVGIQLPNFDAIHILDHTRSILIWAPMEENTIPNQDANLENVIQNASDDQISIFTYKNIRDLKAVGIEVKPCTTGENPFSWSNVHFSSNWLGGELRLPNALIDSAEDVKELRLSGTLVNMLASDEDLANLINEMGNDLPTKLSVMHNTCAVVFSTKYINVKRQIEKHYSTKWRRWLAQGEFLLYKSFIDANNRHMKKDTNQATQDLFEKIKGDMKELKKLFTKDAILEGGYDDNDLTWMFIVDGCSALYFMENVDRHHPEALNIKLDQLMYIWRDMHLLENQLPMRLLKLLSESGEGNLNYLLFNFPTMGTIKGLAMIPLYNFDAIHILDHSHLNLVGLSMEENTIPNQDDKL